MNESVAVCVKGKHKLFYIRSIIIYKGKIYGLPSINFTECQYSGADCKDPAKR